MKIVVEVEEIMDGYCAKAYIEQAKMDRVEIGCFCSSDKRKAIANIRIWLARLHRASKKFAQSGSIVRDAQ